MPRVTVRDAKIFGSRPHSAAVDFIVVAGAPIVQRRHFDFGLYLFRHTGMIRFRPRKVKAELSKVIHGIFTVSHHNVSSSADGPRMAPRHSPFLGSNETALTIA